MNQNLLSIPDLVRSAKYDDSSYRLLKQLYPRREFRRKHCDIYGTVIVCRGKGTKAKWRKM